MAVSISQENPQLFLDTLTGYVLEPLDAAKVALNREERELSAECSALESFRDNVVRIETESPVRQPVPSISGTEQTGGTDSVRMAYEKTFFALEHQADVYAESLVESLAQEFGWDFAAALRPGTNMQFSPQLKAGLVAAIEKSVEERESLLACIDTEQDSVETALNAITSILDTLDSGVIPEWYRTQFRAELDEILQTRQRTLHDRTESFDNHDFCAYLYDDAVWTYPVLTSVARLRESVTLH